MAHLLVSSGGSSSCSSSWSSSSSSSWCFYDTQLLIGDTHHQQYTKAPDPNTIWNNATRRVSFSYQVPSISNSSGNVSFCCIDFSCDLQKKKKNYRTFNILQPFFNNLNGMKPMFWYLALKLARIRHFPDHFSPIYCPCFQKFDFIDVLGWKVDVFTNFNQFPTILTNSVSTPKWIERNEMKMFWLFFRFRFVRCPENNSVSTPKFKLSNQVLLIGRVLLIT